MAIRVQQFKRPKSLEELENNFSLSSSKAPLPTYDALRDSNLRQHFESKTVQKYLQSAGWIDKTGKIIDLDRFRAKLNIIEQEFKYAEKTEFWRMKEEEDMRRTIQIKRERALEDAKRQERAAKIKEENRIRRGIILAVRNQAGAGFTFGSGGGGSTSRSSAGGSDKGWVQMLSNWPDATALALRERATAQAVRLPRRWAVAGAFSSPSTQESSALAGCCDQLAAVSFGCFLPLKRGEKALSLLSSSSSSFASSLTFRCSLFHYPLSRKPLQRGPLGPPPTPSSPPTLAPSPPPSLLATCWQSTRHCLPPDEDTAAAAAAAAA
eukprot:CAMPEP_0172175132 /NCGR_PEP_ID=MMETSP1050-20130122/14048_1 /TAXON_ID=233186 /ORGANISM="Cryptomonas curvata, Strain CCAP979/52" /LENGTH=322 /DNA_ID=CAMNT_0012847181 /DNA_START=155 /DNA_END=1120 /DNA_ORIENTATION=-